jgi:ribokinase
MAKPRIVVVGSSNTDMIIGIDHLPQPGETILGGKFSTAPGGKGANQAVAVARAGGEVTFVARVGQDMFGDKAINAFLEDGIHAEYVTRDPVAPSGVAMIFVAKDGQNTIAVASGANALLAPDDVRKAAHAFHGADSVLMQLETPLESVQAAAETAARIKVPVILNPAPARKLPVELLRRVSILTPNETEAELLTGISVMNEPSAAQAAELLLAQGVQTVIITLGARGAFLANASVRQLVPGFRVKPVDTTAAGDVFNGALAVALAEGKPLAEAARFSNAAAAISVTRLGAQPSAPRRMEIEKFLQTARP